MAAAGPVRTALQIRLVILVWAARLGTPVHHEREHRAIGSPVVKMDAPLPDPNPASSRRCSCSTGSRWSWRPTSRASRASLGELFDLSLPADARDLVFAAAADTRAGPASPRRVARPGERRAGGGRGRGDRVPGLRPRRSSWPCWRCRAASAPTNGPTGDCSSRPRATPAKPSPLILDADGTPSSRPRAAASSCARRRAVDAAGRRAAAPRRHAGARDRAGRSGGHRGARGGAAPRAPARGRRGLHDRGRARRGAGRAARGACAEWERASSRPRISADLRSLWFS